MTSQLTLGNLTVDRARYIAWVDDQEVDLTFVEFELLYTLARNAGKVMSRERLASIVWQEPTDESHRITVHISRLRKKLAKCEPWRIETVTKRGYIMKEIPKTQRTASFRQGPPIRTAGAQR